MSEILDWESYNVGHKFLSGKKDEKHIDGVIFGGNFYICIKPHTKTKDNYPGSKADKENGYWKLCNIDNTINDIIDDIISINQAHELEARLQHLLNWFYLK